ncbi:MAG: hypothetical protein M3P40_11170 [Actinomycetota bacterium]|nr:hypothetical protein [Actinomycetota bacterium]
MARQIARRITEPHIVSGETPASVDVLVESEQHDIVVLEDKSADPAGWRSAERAQFLIDTVGGVTKLAKTLGVSKSQPSRWKSGQEIPSPEVAAKLLDLDHVLALAVQTWHPTVVMDWMTTANGFLEGARPIDVLLQRGSAEVIDALKATLSGAYA